VVVAVVRLEFYVKRTSTDVPGEASDKATPRVDVLAAEEASGFSWPDDALVEESDSALEEADGLEAVGAAPRMWFSTNKFLAELKTALRFFPQPLVGFLHEPHTHHPYFLPRVKPLCVFFPRWPSVGSQKLVGPLNSPTTGAVGCSRGMPSSRSSFNWLSSSTRNTT
jgi:hypothetical protein